MANRLPKVTTLRVWPSVRIFGRTGGARQLTTVGGEHYFSAEPRRASATDDVEFTAAGHGFRLAAGSGVFSAGRLDPGTAVLLRKAVLPAASTEGALLDLGCGYGPIACVLGTVAPARDRLRRGRQRARAASWPVPTHTTRGSADRVIAVRPTRCRRTSGSPRSGPTLRSASARSELHAPAAPLAAPAGRPEAPRGSWSPGTSAATRWRDWLAGPERHGRLTVARHASQKGFGSSGSRDRPTPDRPQASPNSSRASAGDVAENA